MLGYEQVISVMESQKVLAIKVYDLNDNMICSMQEPNTTLVIKRFRGMHDIMKACTKISVEAVNEDQLKQNWKQRFSWLVDFSPATPAQAAVSGINGQPFNPDYIHKDTVMKQIELKMLEMKLEQMQKDLSKKEKDDPIMKYLPLAGKFLGWGKEDFKDIFGQYMMMNNPEAFMKMGAPGLSGPSTTLTMETDVKKMSEEQKIKAMEELMQALVLHPNVGFEKTYTLMLAINKNPAFADMALNFINNQK